MRKIFFILFAMILFSCSQQESNNSNDLDKVDGGPCSYQEDYFPIKILEIDSSNTNNCELTLLKLLEEDTIYYSHYNPNLLELKEIQSKGIKQDDTITFVEMNIEKGSCNPFIQTVYLELYAFKMQE